MHLTISVLGPLQVCLNGKKINQFEFERVRALLIYIFVEADHQHDRAMLASMLWPEEPHKKGLQNLRQTLAALKRGLKEKQLETPFLLTTTNTIGVNPDSSFSIDIHNFSELIKQTKLHLHRRLEACSTCIDKLEKISQLYRGDFACDIRVDSQSFEEWLLFKQEQTHVQAMRTLACLTDYYLRHKQFAQALQKARQQIALFSLSEIGHHQLIQALAADGHRHAALKHCETYKALLAEELMVPLPTKTAELYQKLSAETWDPISFYPVLQHNLPKPITSFVGYDRKLSLIHEYLSKPNNRLITLIGIVGSGKSRTVIEAAWKEISNFSNGVYYINCENLQADQLLDTIANIFLPTKPSKDQIMAHLSSYLHDKEVLLVLDHFDLAFTDSVATIRMLLHAIPGLYLLVTSQSLLRLQGEKYLEMTGLKFQHNIEDKSFYYNPAIRFFLQSVNVWQPNFKLETNEDKKAVLKICEYCDGNPRALEIFAYGVTFIPLNQILSDIHNVIIPGDLLNNDTPQRQCSLQNMFINSWQCLSAKEQDLLVSLSVFRSNFSPMAAQSIVQVNPALLLSLHAKSWLQLKCPLKIKKDRFSDCQGCQHRSQACSYRIPKLFHAYVNQFLQKNLTKQYNLQKAHAIYYMNFMRQHMDNLLNSTNQKGILSSVYQEIENIQQAWNWAVDCRVKDIAAQLEHDLLFYYIVENRQHRHEKTTTSIPPLTYVLSQMQKTTATYHAVATAD